MIESAKGVWRYLWSGRSPEEVARERMRDLGMPDPARKELGGSPGLRTPVAFVNTDTPDLLELRNVSQSYGEKIVLQGVDLLVEAKPDGGRFVVVLGGSGCGKSTLLRYFTGLQEPTSGEVLIDGRPRLDSDLVGMVFQQYSSSPFYTALENVMLGLLFQGVSRVEARDRAMAMLDLVGLADRAHAYAKTPTLSGGQLQRVAIARSLVCNPSKLLMDEPFGALDVVVRAQLQALVASIWERLHMTILFVTHDIPEAVFLADDIYLMSRNPGQIVEHVSVADLGVHRDRATKRQPRFVEYVNYLEDRMIALETAA